MIQSTSELAEPQARFEGGVRRSSPGARSQQKLWQGDQRARQVTNSGIAVSYTHLDVYKRQVVTEVGVRENQTLQQSAVLARLSDWRPRYDVASTRAELERKRNELELLLHGPKPEAIAYAQHQVDLARIKAASSKKLQDVLAVAAKQGVAPELRYTEAIGNAEADKAALAVRFPVVRRWFDFLNGLFYDARDIAPGEAIFPPPSSLSAEQHARAEQRLAGMELGSESVFVACLLYTSRCV